MEWYQRLLSQFIFKWKKSCVFFLCCLLLFFCRIKRAADLKGYHMCASKFIELLFCCFFSLILLVCSNIERCLKEILLFLNYTLKKKMYFVLFLFWYTRYLSLVVYRNLSTIFIGVTTIKLLGARRAHGKKGWMAREKILKRNKSSYFVMLHNWCSVCVQSVNISLTHILIGNEIASVALKWYMETIGKSMSNQCVNQQDSHVQRDRNFSMACVNTFEIYIKKQ